MKYITSCPQCDTQFLLDDDLIKAYRGKVQCGSCEHVFNAKNRLTEVGDDITSADEYQSTLESKSQENTVKPETAAISTESVATAEVIQETAQQVDKADSSDKTDVDYIIGKSSPKVKPPAEEAVPDATIDLDNLKKKNKKPRQYSFLSLLIGFLLVLAVILQAAYFLRGKIASEYPQLKPTLEHVCKKLKCTIDLPRNLDLISIGDSDMQEDDGFQSVINFSSSLKNNAKYTQAYPNIELTLTDSDDVPVIKKLVTPKDYLTSKKKINQGLAPHEVANIKIALRVDEASVASYRLLLLY